MITWENKIIVILAEFNNYTANLQAVTNQVVQLTNTNDQLMARVNVLTAAAPVEISCQVEVFLNPG